MLYINNPEARNAIIEGCRRDGGQHLIDVTDTTMPGTTTRTPRAGSLRRRIARTVDVA